MTFTPFTSPEAALEACEAAGLEPLQGCDYPTGNKYAVFLPGFERYINCYGDAQFLSWANSYFRMRHLRITAGWTFNRTVGWVSPDGFTEMEWCEQNHPFPEDEDFEPTPYPNAPAQAGE